MTHKRHVDPALYTKEYYLTACTGYATFTQTHGTVLEPRLQTVVDNAPPCAGARVLDIGCGRGELVFYAASRGAKYAIGIDYSQESIAISREARDQQSEERQKNTRFFKADATRLPFPNSSFDYIFCTEVWEHLYPEEVATMLAEIRRVLSPHGILVVHTAPTWIFNDYTYRFWCYPLSSLLLFFFMLFTGKTYPNILHPSALRGEYERSMHVNESSHWAVYTALQREGFSARVWSTNQTVNKPILSWKDRIFNAVVYLSPLSSYFPWFCIWGNDVFAVARKKA